MYDLKNQRCLISPSLNKARDFYEKDHFLEVGHKTSNLSSLQNSTLQKPKSVQYMWKRAGTSHHSKWSHWVEFNSCQLGTQMSMNLLQLKSWRQGMAVGMHGLYLRQANSTRWQVNWDEEGWPRTRYRSWTSGLLKWVAQSISKEPCTGY